jgi:hypothetical protein
MDGRDDQPFFHHRIASCRRWAVAAQRRLPRAAKPKACRPMRNAGAQCIPEAVSCIILNASSRVKVLGF